MSSALAPVQNGALATDKNTGGIMFDVIAKGDLSSLKPDQLARYYVETCESIGVNPLTKPFEYISLNNKLTLYALKTCTDQLRTVHGISIFQVDAVTTENGVRVVTAYARAKDGREDMDIGAVNVKGLAGEFLANAYMKALTKAKRRVTLSICGLGWLDESEVDSIPNARQPITVNVQDGEIVATPNEQADEQPHPKESQAPRAMDWTEFWRQAKAVKIAKADFVEIIQREPNSFASPQDAWDALSFALEQLAASQVNPEAVEAEYEVDPDTGEIHQPSMAGMGSDPGRYTR